MSKEKRELQRQSLVGNIDNLIEKVHVFLDRDLDESQNTRDLAPELFDHLDQAMNLIKDLD